MLSSSNNKKYKSIIYSFLKNIFEIQQFYILTILSLYCYFECFYPTRQWMFKTFFKGSNVTTDNKE